MLEALRNRKRADDAGRGRVQAETDAAELRLATSTAVEAALTARLRAASERTPDLDRARWFEVELQQVGSLLARVNARLGRVKLATRADSPLRIWNLARPSSQPEHPSWSIAATVALIASVAMLIATLAVGPAGKRPPLPGDGDI